MRIGLIVICGLALLMLASASPAKCYDCKKNECECKRKILKASTVAPSRFTKTKVCEETNPTDLHPIKDICSCTDVAQVRPHSRHHDETPRFAHSTSCECGYEDNSQPNSQPVKYSADAVSQHLAIIAARKKEISVSETDLHFHGKALRVAPEGSSTPDIKEERLHKYNRQLIELKPAKKKQVYQPESSEEESFPCQPEQQSYSDICYGKVQAQLNKFEHVHEEAPVCETCQDTYSDESYSKERSHGGSSHGSSHGSKKHIKEQYYHEEHEEHEAEESGEEQEEEQYEEKEEVKEEKKESKYEKKTESKYVKKTESKHKQSQGESEGKASGYSEDEEAESEAESEEDEEDEEEEEEEEEDEDDDEEEEEEEEDDEEDDDEEEEEDEESYEAPKKGCGKKKKQPYKKRSVLEYPEAVNKGNVATSNSLKPQTIN